MADHRATVHTLLTRAGRTFAEQAGFTLRDRPSPLWQLATLSIVLAKPISNQLAVDACAELRKAGGNTPNGMLALTWQQRVDALGRAHYRRFDESIATRMAEAATHVTERWSGDLRRLADSADGSAARAHALLQEIPGIGPAGADIYLREAQAVWPWLRPFLDDRALDGARAVGLPARADALAELVEPAHLAELAAALVRLTVDDDLAGAVRDAA